MSSFGSVQTTSFVDLDCDAAGCRSTAAFKGANWAICEDAALAAGWRLEKGSGRCVCPNCAVKPQDAGCTVRSSRAEFHLH
jgi:hypothetical protein